MTSSNKIQPVIVDARAAAYAGEAIRVLAVALPSSGRVLVQKLAPWKAPVVENENTVVVTDTPMIFDHWDMSFNESEQMKEVLAVYNEAMRSGLVKIEDELRRYEPKDVIQMRKMDERGQALDLDSFGINNGHMAVLLAIWAARKIHGGHIITTQSTTLEYSETSERTDSSLLPFSI